TPQKVAYLVYTSRPGLSTEKCKKAKEIIFAAGFYLFFQNPPGAQKRGRSAAAPAPSVLP
ncbi:MAG: hypothetical protein MSA25_04125, partial [Clostridiales bacterium]|nr:hypothetical protein [Clostridiales bacterium]